MGVGSLVRNQAVAVVALLVLLFVVEPVVGGRWPSGRRFGPLLGAPSAIAEPEGLSLEAEEGLLSPGAGVLVMLAWIAVTTAFGALLLHRRNVD